MGCKAKSLIALCATGILLTTPINSIAQNNTQSCTAEFFNTSNQFLYYFDRGKFDDAFRFVRSEYRPMRNLSEFKKYFSERRKKVGGNPIYVEYSENALKYKKSTAERLKRNFQRKVTKSSLYRLNGRATCAITYEVEYPTAFASEYIYITKAGDTLKVMRFDDGAW